MFLKKTLCGMIKDQGCANGRKQREHMTKDETSSPTVATKSLMLSCIIDAKERWDVATADIPRAFMQADMEGEVHMKMEGTIAELLVKLDPKLYRKCVQTQHGKSVMCVKLKKALYGTLQAALLFQENLSKSLKEWGFEINPFDWCVANKMMDGKQCIILWHVDDIKISHANPKVVDRILGLLQGRYGKESPLTVTRGKVHKYLDMTIDYRKDGRVKFTMFDYIKNMLADLPADMDGEAATPAPVHLFQVNEKDMKKVSEDKAQLYHHNVAKLLFLSRRATRPDIQTSVAFLCMRVKEPDTDDYKKLAPCMKYLRQSAVLSLILETEVSNIIKWWVDGACAVHNDMKSHMGALMSLGKGAAYATSTRQKLNTRSSTEAKLIEVDDVMALVLWTRYFLEAQGYSIDNNIMYYQDNQSAMLLEKNGRRSSGKRTRHINICYFFVADRISAEKVRVDYCPTGCWKNGN
jgi:hypothetical protein